MALEANRRGTGATILQRHGALPEEQAKGTFIDNLGEKDERICLVGTKYSRRPITHHLH